MSKGPAFLHTKKHIPHAARPARDLLSQHRKASYQASGGTGWMTSRCLSKLSKLVEWFAFPRSHLSRLLLFSD
jgi:hypothetical protein